MKGALLLLALAGCAAKPPKPPHARLDSLQIEAAPDANWRSGTRIDLVFAFSAAADAQLPPASPAWFAAKPDLLKEHGGALLVYELQLPAHYPAAQEPLPAGHEKAIGVYSYASYLAAPGQARCRLTDMRHAALRLDYETVECTSQPSPAGLAARLTAGAAMKVKKLLKGRLP